MSEQEDVFEDNPARYRRLSEPFDDNEEANTAIMSFFDGVKKLREEHGIADVFLVVEVQIGQDARHGDASLYLGDVAHKMPMLARAYGCARAEHEEAMAKNIKAGREHFARRSGERSRR